MMPVVVCCLMLAGPAPVDTAAVAARLAPATGGGAAWVERTLEDMPVRDKVAQMVMPWIPGGRPDRNSAEWRRTRRLVEEDRVGGFIVARGGAAETAGWLNELQRLSRLPLLIAADLEWGAGMRFPEATLLPINMALSAAGSPALSREAGRITAVEARAVGVHLLFAPVADVNINALNPVINTRSYGADPAAVATRVVAFIEGARSAGALPVVKHFPGHGDTEYDSHLVMPLLDLDRRRLEAVELAPFRAAIVAGAPAIMTAHLAVPALEPPGTPYRAATYSPAILTDLLRGELGFQGLIVTDALNMEGARIPEGTGRAAVRAVLAGADILLMPANATVAIDSVTAAVLAGEIAESRIDDSLRRILMAKAEMGLDLDRTVDVDELGAVLGAEEHKAWARDVADRSVTVVRMPAGSLPLRLRGRQVVSVEYADARQRVSGDELRRALEDTGAELRQIRIWRGSTPAELAAAERSAANAEVVIFASFARALPWRGSLGLPEPAAALADRLARQGAIVISFGDPYLLRQLPNANSYILAWSESELAQRAAVRALSGEIAVGGRLPIPLPPHHSAGDGIALPALADRPNLPDHSPETGEPDVPGGDQMAVLRARQFSRPFAGRRPPVTAKRGRQASTSGEPIPRSTGRRPER